MDKPSLQPGTRTVTITDIHLGLLPVLGQRPTQPGGSGASRWLFHLRL